MAASVSMKTVFITLGCAFTSVVALPTETVKTYPEVIPGPGLPSLAEMGMTSEQLYTMTPNIAPRDTFAALYNAECRHCPDAEARVEDVIACFNYLNGLGQKGCRLEPYTGALMCSAGTARVDGLNYSPNQASAVVSYCSDVAKAVQWVFTNCNQGGQVRGSAAANGNGDLVVRSQNINYIGWC